MNPHESIWSRVPDETFNYDEILNDDQFATENHPDQYLNDTTSSRQNDNRTVSNSGKTVQLTSIKQTPIGSNATKHNYVIGWTLDRKIKPHYSIEYYPDHMTVYVKFYISNDTVFDIGHMLVSQYGIGNVEFENGCAMIWMSTLNDILCGTSRQTFGPYDKTAYERVSTRAPVRGYTSLAPPAPTTPPTQPLAPPALPAQTLMPAWSKTAIDFEAIYRKYCESASRPVIDMDSIRGSTKLRNFINNITGQVYSAGQIQQICEWLALRVNA